MQVIRSQTDTNYRINTELVIPIFILSISNNLHYMTNLSKTSLLLFLVVIGLSYAADDYQEIPPAQQSQYTLIPSLRSFGINGVLNNALQTGKIQSTDFTLYSTNHIYLKVSGTLSYYKFDLSLKNAKGDQLNTVFVVTYNTKTKKQTLVSYSYNLKYASTTTPPAGGYVLIPSSEYTSTLIQSLANFGKNYVVSQAVSKSKLPSGVYGLTLINSVKKQVLQSVTNYRFDVVFEKNDGSREVEATYDIAYTVASGKMSVIAYNYKVLPYSV